VSQLSPAGSGMFIATPTNLCTRASSTWRRSSGSPGCKRMHALRPNASRSFWRRAFTHVVVMRLLILVFERSLLPHLVSPSFYPIFLKKFKHCRIKVFTLKLAFFRSLPTPLSSLSYFQVKRFLPPVNCPPPHLYQPSLPNEKHGSSSVLDALAAANFLG